MNKIRELQLQSLRESKIEISNDKEYRSPFKQSIPITSSSRSPIVIPSHPSSSSSPPPPPKSMSSSTQVPSQSQQTLVNDVENDVYRTMWEQLQ